MVISIFSAWDEETEGCAACAESLGLPRGQLKSDLNHVLGILAQSSFPHRLFTMGLHTTATAFSALPLPPSALMCPLQHQWLPIIEEMNSLCSGRKIGVFV